MVTIVKADEHSRCSGESEVLQVKQADVDVLPLFCIDEQPLSLNGRKAIKFWILMLHTDATDW